MNAAPLPNVAALFDVQELIRFGFPALSHYPQQAALPWVAPMLPEADGAVPEWPPGEGLRVFAYLHAAHPHCATVLRAIAARRLTTVLHVPGLTPPALEAMVGAKALERVQLHTEPVCMAAVLAECDMVVCHGVGTLSAGLAAGKRVLHLPGHLEQDMVLSGCCRGVLVGAYCTVQSRRGWRRLWMQCCGSRCTNVAVAHRTTVALNTLTKEGSVTHPLTARRVDPTLTRLIQLKEAEAMRTGDFLGHNSTVRTSRAVPIAARLLCMAALGLPGFASGNAVAQTTPSPKAGIGQQLGNSGRLRYDPATCSRDPQGMVFFAVGRRVLRQPLENLVYMMGGSPAERAALPRVRNVEEPIGCPDHPIQMFTYHLKQVSAGASNTNERFPNTNLVSVVYNTFAIGTSLSRLVLADAKYLQDSTYALDFINLAIRICLHQDLEDETKINHILGESLVWSSPRARIGNVDFEIGRRAQTQNDFEAKHGFSVFYLHLTPEFSALSLSSPAVSLSVAAATAGVRSTSCVRTVDVIALLDAAGERITPNSPEIDSSYELDRKVQVTLLSDTGCLSNITFFIQPFGR